MYGFLNHYGERFQKDAVLVRGFTGFVCKECLVLNKKNNMWVHVDMA